MQVENPYFPNHEYSFLMLSGIGATFDFGGLLPFITSYLVSFVTVAGWTISVYQLGYTVTMPIVGKISAMF